VFAFKPTEVRLPGSPRTTAILQARTGSCIRNLLTGWVATAEEIGVWIKSGRNNFVTNGTASATGYAGIALGCVQGYERYCDGGQAVANTLLNNEADWNGRYGVVLSAKSSDTTVTHPLRLQ